MSLNQLVNYERNEIIKNEIKARKLGLTTGNDNEPVFVSNTGDKQLVTRKLTPSDFEYGEFTLYKMVSPFIKEIPPTPVLQDFYIINQFVGGKLGSPVIDLRKFKAGYVLNLEYWGYYTNSQGTTEDNTLSRIGLIFENQTIFWDFTVDSDPDSLTAFPGAVSAVTDSPRSFTYKFQVVATTDWNFEYNSINMMASGVFMANCNTTDDNGAMKATYRMKDFALEQSSMGTPVPFVYNVISKDNTYYPAFNGFVLYYQGMNYTLSKGLYPVYEIPP
jgi:hypothetical protein